MPNNEAIQINIDYEKIAENVDVECDCEHKEHEALGLPENYQITELDTSSIGNDENYYVLLATLDSQVARVNGTLRGYRGKSSTRTNDVIELLASSNSEASWNVTHSKLSVNSSPPDTRFVTLVLDGDTYIALESAVGNHRNYDDNLVFEGLLKNASLQVVGETEVEKVVPVPDKMKTGELKHDGSDGLKQVRGRLDNLIDRLELSVEPENEWRVGPAAPKGSFHSNPLWGTHFHADRQFRLGEAAIESNQSAEITVRLFNYSGGEIQGVEDETTISTIGGVQDVQLDLHGGPGEYLLARPVANDRKDEEIYSDLVPGAFVNEPIGCALRRMEDYSGWDNDSRHGIDLHGTANPVYSDNKNWYHFHNLQVCTGGER